VICGDSLRLQDKEIGFAIVRKESNMEEIVEDKLNKIQKAVREEKPRRNRIYIDLRVIIFNFLWIKNWND
jgi:hypothetical protein